MPSPSSLSSPKSTELLYTALGEPRGLVLWTSDPSRLRQRLYQARVKLGDPKLDVLQFSLVELGEGKGKGNFAILKTQLSSKHKSKELEL